MNHSELKKKLFDWHDGRLASGEANEVSRHIKACPECDAELDGWKQTASVFLNPLRAQDNLLFTQNVLRKIRLSQTAEGLARPRFFARWAFPALALSLGSFAAALLYVAQPAAVSAEGLFLADQQATPSEWISSVANDDQILGSVVEKP